MDFPGRLMAAFLAVILIVLFPTQYIAASAEKNIDSYIANSTEQFSDAIREKGYLDTAMYEKYIRGLDESGERYELEVEDIHPVTGDEVAFYDGEDTLVAASALSSQKPEHGAACSCSLCSGESSRTELLSSENKKTAVRPLQRSLQSNEIQSFSNHTHTDDCYEGHRHIPMYSEDYLSGHKVYLTGGFNSKWNYTYQANMVSYRICCADCDATIVSMLLGIDSAGTGIVGFISYYSYDGSAVVENKINIAVSGAYKQSPLYLFMTQFQNKVTADLAALGIRAGVKNDTSNHFYFTDAFPYSGIPVFDASGNISSYMPVRCTNLYGHFNTSSCYYTGKMTKVQYLFKAKEVDSGLVTGNLAIICADCGRTLVNISFCFAPNSTSNNSITGMETVWYEYDQNGNATRRRSSGYLERGKRNYWGGSYGLGLDFSTADRNTIKSLYNTISKIGAWQYTNTFVSGMRTYYYTSVTDPVITSIPVRSSSTLEGTITWIPFMGCPYCGTFGTRSCGEEEDTTPDCDRVVTSITATNPSQTVRIGESIITTATATYLDGHTGIVNCTSNFNPYQSGPQKVTLTYSGLVHNAKTQGSVTCTVNVTVISKILDYITVTPVSQIIPRMGVPAYTVTAHYKDGTSTVLTSGQYSVSALNTSTAGVKTATITYTEGGITKKAAVTVYVDSISSISISPEELSVERYTKADALPLSVTAVYLYSAGKVLTGGYTISGYSPSVTGDQTITVTYTENGTTVSAKALIHVTPLHKTCPVCGKVYELNPDDTDPGCPYCKDIITGITVTPGEAEITQGESLPVSVKAIYRDGSSREVEGWTSSYQPEQTGLQLVKIEYGGYSAYLYVNVKEQMLTCPVCGTRYPASEGSCPICREKVDTITVNPSKITVNQYDAINLEVTAAYADGSTKTVTGWSIDRTSAAAGTFTATVSFGGRSAEIELTVLSASMATCPVCGLVYDSGKFPNGCPVCSEIVTGIEAFLTNGSYLVQYGRQPDMTAVLIFRDTHREILKDGYTVAGYKADQLGPQTVTVCYKEFSCTLKLEVVNAADSITCPKGHVYYRDGDRNDPGCPFCAAVKEKETVYYYDITYLPEILEEVYKNGVYYFTEHNYVTVRLTKKDVSLLTRIQKMSFKLVMLGRKRRFRYGGEVR